MKFKKIVGFGDSFVYGDELLDPKLDPTTHHSNELNTAYREQHCFLGRIGCYYQCPVENFGQSGGSLQSAMWTFLWWLEHEPNPEQCLILIGLTNSYRFSHYNPGRQLSPNDPQWNRFAHSTWTENDYPQFENLIKLQTTLTDCSELRQLRYQAAAVLFDGASARRNLSLAQFNVFAPPAQISNTPTLLWPDWSIVDWINGHPEYKKPNGHPNEQGHQTIANRLISHWDSCIIKG
jgi:hypothetical protein